MHVNEVCHCRAKAQKSAINYYCLACTYHSSLANYSQGPHSYPLSDIVPSLLFSPESSPFFKAQLKVLLLQEVLLDSLPLLLAPFHLLLAGSLLRALKLSSFSLIWLLITYFFYIS